MLSCSSRIGFSIEKVSAYALIFFLPFAMESVITTDHYDLTVVHQISIPLGQNIGNGGQHKRGALQYSW